MLEIGYRVFIAVPLSIYQKVYGRLTPVLVLSFVLMAVGCAMFVQAYRLMPLRAIGVVLGTRLAATLVSTFVPGASLSAQEGRIVGAGALLVYVLVDRKRRATAIVAASSLHGRALALLVLAAGVRLLNNLKTVSVRTGLTQVPEELVTHGMTVVWALYAGVLETGAVRLPSQQLAALAVAVAGSFLQRFEEDRIMYSL